MFTCTPGRLQRFTLYYEGRLQASPYPLIYLNIKFVTLSTHELCLCICICVKTPMGGVQHTLVLETTEITTCRLVVYHMLEIQNYNLNQEYGSM